MTSGDASDRTLGSRGLRFAAEVEASKPGMGPGERVLLEEACRLVDRLDRFDALISGDLSAWLSIEWPFEDAPAALVISSVVGEARQSVAELRQVVKQLAIPEAKVVPRADGGRPTLEGLRGGKTG